MKLKQLIENKLQSALKPQICWVEDESYLHHVPIGTESHFKVILCSSVFNGLNAVKRHQAVYQILSELIPVPIHALSIHAYAPEEWTDEIKIRHSPACEGGSNG